MTKTSVRIKTLDAESILAALVPSEKMTRPVWLAIACAAKKCAVSYEEWKETHSKRWSASSGQFVEEMTPSRWNDLNRSGGNTLGLPYLKACALASGALTKDLIADIGIKEAFELNLEGTKHTRVNEQYPNVSMVDTPGAKCTVLCPGTGTAKSFIMREIVKRPSLIHN